MQSSWACTGIGGGAAVAAGAPKMMKNAGTGKADEQAVLEKAEVGV